MTLRNYELYIANSKDCQHPYLVLIDEEVDSTPLEQYKYRLSTNASSWYEAHYSLVNVYLKGEVYSASIPKEESDVDIFLKAFNWELYTGFPIEASEDSYSDIEDYKYLVGHKGYQELRVVLLEGDLVVITAKWPNGKEVILSGEDFYENGKSIEEVLENAGSYLCGALH